MDPKPPCIKWQPLEDSKLFREDVMLDVWSNSTKTNIGTLQENFWAWSKNNDIQYDLC